MFDLAPFLPPPGIVHDGTDYSSKGTWYDCDKVRFRGGFPERIGGWSRMTTDQFAGKCRLLFQWTDLSGVLHTAVATHKKLYIENSTGALNDKTPLRPMVLPNDPIATTNASVNVTVTHTAHGLSTGDRVIVSGATATGGITTAQLNTIHTITVLTADTYRITMSSAASSTATGGGSAVNVVYSRDFYVPLPSGPFTTTNGSSAITVTHTNHGAAVGDYVTLNAAAGVTLNNIEIIANTSPYTAEYTVTSVTDANNYVITGSSNANASSSGGGTVYAQYQISIGDESFTPSSGFGSGGFGAGPFGTGGGSAAIGDQPRLWSADAFGEDIIVCIRGGAIYKYDTSVGQRATDIRLESDEDGAPSQANYVLISDEDRRIFACGVTDPNSGVFDPLLLRWSDSESAGNWAPGTATTSGSLRLSTGSGIRCALKTKGEVLVWTDSSLTSVRFADVFVYGQTLISPNIDIVGQNSAIAVDDLVLWMGQENFFVYDGRVQTMPCSVRQYVFSNINIAQGFKVTAGTNRQFREVWWLYPSADSEENDRYVVFNYAEKWWYYGTLNRTAWNDVGDRANPIAASTDGYVYLHEYGLDDEENDTAVSAYIESSPIELGSGGRFLFVRRVIPDVTFDESVTASPSVTYTLKPRNFPGGSYGTPDSGSTVRTASSPVEMWTEKLDVRLRGRHFVLRVSSNTSGVKWRLGTQRFDVRPDGKR